MTTAVPILFFDLGSPYAYLAVQRAASVLGARPELEPVLLGGIFAQRGYGSWSGTPLRDVRVAEIERRASHYGLPPLRWPAKWPVDGLTAMRCATWAKHAGAVDEFARAVFRREFAAGEDISDPAALRAAAADSGLDGERMLRAATLPQTKTALRAATQRAWELGVRGVPSLRVGDAIFYGDDQLELAAAMGRPDAAPLDP